MISNYVFGALDWFRQNVLIYVQLAIPDSIIYSVHHDDYVGELDVELNEFIRWADRHPNVFRNYLSAVRWRRNDGVRQIEAGSWAYRRNGRFCDFQYHFSPMVSDHGKLELYCHREYNPLRHPILHLMEKEFSGPEGVKFARNVNIG